MKKIYILLFTAVVALSVHTSATKTDYKAFTMSKGYGSSYIELYKTLLEDNDKILMTSDFLFYMQHLAMDYSLRYMETEYMIDRLGRFIDDMIIEMMILNSDEMNEKMMDSYKLSMGYLYTAKALLMPGTIVPEAYGAVDRELELINEHSRIMKSPLFSREDDYSQYKPRGHYNDSDELKRYFKAMMWLQRMRFSTICKDSDPYVQMRSALMLSKAYMKHSEFFEENIYRPISILLQNSDDIRLAEIYNAWAGMGFSDSDLCSDNAMKKIAEKAAQLNKAAIVSDIVGDDEEMPVFMGIMGQRYIFDSEVFQQLVYNNVTLYTGSNKAAFTLGGDIRIVPRGLDLFYTLGSTHAYLILEEEGDVQYLGYRENVKKMQEKYKQLPFEDNYYNRVLKQFTMMINHRKDNAPLFMLDKRWYKKELNTMLAAWASLRHDVILYAKQSYTIRATSKMPGSSIEYSIICEPYTQLYDGMKTDLHFLFDELYKQTGDAVFTDLDESYSRLTELYIDISKYTLKKQVYRDREALISAIGLTDYYLKKLLVNKDEKQDNAVIVADVHTDPNTMQVLEEAVGPPAVITAEFMNENFKGYAMSYFEFTNPLSSRMTDEEWRERVRTEDTDKLLLQWQKELYDKDNKR